MQATKAESTHNTRRTSTALLVAGLAAAAGVSALVLLAFRRRQRSRSAKAGAAGAAVAAAAMAAASSPCETAAPGGPVIAAAAVSDGSLYAMPAYTSLTVVQAQLVFDVFRPPVDVTRPRRFVVSAVKELQGGLSNSNYCITVYDTTTAAERKYLLKICEEKDAKAVRTEVRALDLIRRISSDPHVPLASPAFQRPCPIAYPYRVGVNAELEEQQQAAFDAASDEEEQSGAEFVLHVPAVTPRAMVMYQYLDGIVVRAPTPAVLSELARAQAQLHSVPLSLPGRSLTFLSDASTAPSFGMFSIQAQFEDQVLSDGPNSRWLSHPFIKFLQPRLAELAACVAQAPALPQAVIHSDLFFENVIFQKPEQGDKVVGIIDFEEMGRGPRVLDVAMTLVGCCYDRSTNLLRFDLARPFVQSYSRFATLDERERQAFIPFLRRWQNFNVVHTNNERRDAYLQMQQRVEELDNKPELVDSIKRALEEAATTV